MCDHSLDLTIERILADELVQLTMASDGVTETEMQRLLEQAHRAIIGHHGRATWEPKRRPVQMLAKCSTREIA
jgi:hypothetical protein